MRVIIPIGDKPHWPLNIKFYVSRTDFAYALAGYYWLNSCPFDIALSRTKAKRLLGDSLYSYGIRGIDQEGWDGSSEEFMKPFNDAYSSALEWVSKNYPNL